MGLGPFFGGILAPVIGLRPVFGVTTVIFFLLSIVLSIFLSGKMAPGTKERQAQVKQP